MKPIIRKLLVSVLALFLTVTMVVMASYAWYTLSDSPIAEGIQVSIGGGDTILIAADVSITENGVTYHYPGYFQDTLIFSQYEQYDYLDRVAGLSPVSTADGVHWYMAEHYDYNDEKVVNGESVVGALKPITEFSCDTDLTHANLGSDQSDLAQKGSYVFVDFWVVSPGADYTLRVSAGESNGVSGSFLLETKMPVMGEDGAYALQESEGYAAASARVGFLVCQDNIIDSKNMELYRASLTYNKDYETLKGMYQQPGEETLYTSGYRFTVYEPNGMLHPNGEQGAYHITSPVGYKGGSAVYADMRSKLTVQLSNEWLTRGETAGASLEDTFTMWKAGQDEISEMSSAQVQQAFYEDFLQRNYLPYVRTGGFVRQTAGLYDGAVDNRIAASDLASVMGEASGATEDTYIVRLEKNIPQRIRMFIWLEGQDIDCQNLNRVSNLVLSIEFAGGSN